MKYVQIEEAEGKRKCNKCGHEIPRGKKCITTHSSSGAWTRDVNICVYCVRDMFMSMIGIPFTNYTGRTNT
jgi:hypothetical protein